MIFLSLRTLLELKIVKIIFSKEDLYKSVKEQV